MRRAAVALLHHPILGRPGPDGEAEILTTTLTNLDMHDMSRSCRTYGLEALYIVHPLASQRTVAERVRRHWVGGPGGKRIPDRAEALRILEVVPELAEAEARLAERCGVGEVELWTTAAADKGGTLTTYAAGRELVQQDGPPVLILFGTGWGLAPEVLEGATRRLEPIRSRRDPSFNHLSVRAACAITLDRLFA